MKGAIIINPFLVPKESVYQAQRLKEEFNKLKVQVDIITDGYLRASISENRLNIDFNDIDFAIYLDKDKYLSAILEKSGIRLFNSHSAIRVCDDKAETIIALENEGVNLPKTVFGPLCYNKNLPVREKDADEIIKKLSLPIIVKECYGSSGKGVYLVNTREELLAKMEEIKLTPHMYQEYIHYIIGVDVRLIVIGKKVVACMKRQNDADFRSNIAQGGIGQVFDCPSEFIKEAEKVATILDLDYCGVDLLIGEGQVPIVCEVNSNAFFNGIESVTKVNVAKLYAEHVLDTIKNKN
mgnify:CR=1 FL=1